MTYKRFEELPVWKSAIKLAEHVFLFTDRAEELLRKRSSLKSQIERAAVSVSNNIAEGFERGTTAELINFLYIARGSAGEVRSMLWLIERLPGFTDFKSEISDLRSEAESCSRQLRAWADSLQESKIKGQRHLTKESKAELNRANEAARIKKERAEFLKELNDQVKQERGF